MHQRWRDLLFLHWEYPREVVQRALPQGLHVDVFEGQAYLGVVPFFMCNVRPWFLPAVPGISNFMEMNLRTYVHDDAGVPGVWFYSLEANRRLAVAIARHVYHLPYCYAAMESERVGNGVIRYRSRRPASPPESGCSFEYAAGRELAPCAPGSFEFFLVERYHLYTTHCDRLLRGTVHHQPYRLFEARVGEWSDALLALNGFRSPGRAPDHQILSTGVEVELFGLQEVRV